MEQQPFSKLPSIPSPEELIDVAFRRASKVTIKMPTRKDRLLIAKLKEIKRVKTVASIIISKLSEIKTGIPKVDSLHPFYRDIFYIFIDPSTFKLSMAKVSKATVLVEKLCRSYVSKIRSAKTIPEVVVARREYYGRVASIIKELKDELSLLSGISMFKRLPTFHFSVPIIIISGAPNVGKSSFVRCVSTAKPEIAEYPFTTKSVSVGHIIGEHGVIAQVVDTPGLLDRPLGERNKIELQAIVALKNLEGGIVFLIDPTETCGYSLDYQINVFRSVKEMFREKPMVIALTKADIASEEQIRGAIERLGGEKVLVCSTLKCIGVQEVVKEILDMVMKSVGRDRWQYA